MSNKIRKQHQTPGEPSRTVIQRKKKRIHGQRARTLLANGEMTQMTPSQLRNLVGMPGGKVVGTTNRNLVIAGEVGVTAGKTVERAGDMVPIIDEVAEGEAEAEGEVEDEEGSRVTGEVIEIIEEGETVLEEEEVIALEEEGTVLD